MPLSIPGRKESRKEPKNQALSEAFKKAGVTTQEEKSNLVFLKNHTQKQEEELVSCANETCDRGKEKTRRTFPRLCPWGRVTLVWDNDKESGVCSQECLKAYYKKRAAYFEKQPS